MDLIVLVLVLCLVGFLTWLLTTQIPMPPMWAKAIQVLTLIALVLWVLGHFVKIPNVLPH